MQSCLPQDGISYTNNRRVVNDNLRLKELNYEYLLSLFKQYSVYRYRTKSERQYFVKGDIYNAG